MFKERLKALRENAGISQYKLAKLIGVTDTAIQAFERGTRMPSANTLMALADEFGCTVDYLLGRQDAM